MKHIILLFVLLVLSLAIYSAKSENVLALTITPTPIKEDSATSASELEKIQKIKAMVASKVAELKLVEKRGFFGRVKEVSNTQITIEDIHKGQRIIDIDELTKFQSLSASKSFGISDIKQGDLISSIGLYNKETKRLLARFVILRKELPVKIEGVVTEKQLKALTMTVVAEGNSKISVDIGKLTTVSSYSKEDGLTKSKFLDITPGQRVMVVGTYSSKDNSAMDASRIIHFVDLLPARSIKVTIAPTIAATATLAPKVNRKATPTPTKKPTPTLKPTVTSSPSATLTP